MARLLDGHSFLAYAVGFLGLKCKGTELTASSIVAASSEDARIVAVFLTVPVYLLIGWIWRALK